MNMLVISVYLASSILAGALLARKRNIISALFVFFSNAPGVSLLFIGAEDYQKFVYFYATQVILNILVVFLVIVLPEKKRQTEPLRINRRSKLKFLGLFVLLFVLVDSVSFRITNPDYFWMMHRGEQVMGSLTHLLLKVGALYALYKLLFSKLNNSDITWAALLLFAPTLYWFVLGFRSPLIVNLLTLVVIGTYYIYRTNGALKKPKKLFFLALALPLVIGVFDFLTQSRSDGGYSLRNPLFATALEVHVGTEAGKRILEQSASNSPGLIEGISSSPSFLCLFFHPNYYSLIIPRTLFLNIADSFDISPTSCRTYSDKFNDNLSAELRVGEGVASNFLGDLWAIFGASATLFYILLFSIIFGIDRMIQTASGFKRQFLVIVLILIVPKAFVIWRLNLFSFPMLDLLLLTALYAMLRVVRRTSTLVS
jgi:hypothetical protein